MMSRSYNIHIKPLSPNSESDNINMGFDDGIIF